MQQKVCRWVKTLKDGQKIVHNDKLRLGSFQRIFCDQRFTISTLSSEYSIVDGTTLYKFVYANLQFFKTVCVSWVPKLLTDKH